MNKKSDFVKNDIIHVSEQYLYNHQTNEKIKSKLHLLEIKKKMYQRQESHVFCTLFMIYSVVKVVQVNASQILIKLSI